MICTVIALESEAEILLEKMEIFRSLVVSGKKIYVGSAFGKDTAVAVCGVGKVNAALGTQLLVSKFDADKILNFGVAGGLNKNTELCGVYQIKAAVQFDFDLVQLNGTQIGTLDEYTENYLRLSPFKAALKKKNLGTADRFNDSAEDYLLLTKELKADIRDMEGAAIVQAAPRGPASRLCRQGDLGRCGKRKHYRAIPSKPRAGLGKSQISIARAFRRTLIKFKKAEKK